MFIQTEDTPNPNTVKFILPELLLPNESMSLTRGSAELSQFPIACILFELAEVIGIFICNNFISVTKEKDAAWEGLKTTILSRLLDALTRKIVLITYKPITKEKTLKEGKEGDISDSIVRQIKELLELRVRPAVAQDGGDIIFHDFRDGIVYLELHGACSGCPSSTVTLKNGIEGMLKHYIPEVEAVEAV